MSRVAKSPHPRAPFDWYVEPSWAVEALFDLVPMLGTVGDPACGRGTIPEVARRRGHPIAASDIVDRGYERLTAVADFLHDPSPMQGVDNIVCNPPYSYRKGIAELFVRQALTLRPATVAVIVPTSWLSSEARFRLFAEHTPHQILHFADRVSMPPGHVLEDLGAQAFRGGRIIYCWVVWSRSDLGEHHSSACVQFIPPRPKRAR